MAYSESCISFGIPITLLCRNGKVKPNTVKGVFSVHTPTAPDDGDPMELMISA